MRQFSVAAAAMLLAIAPAPALDGQPAMHDPSTVIEAGGRFYAYATGNGLPAFQSEDGWTWRGPEQLWRIDQLTDGTYRLEIRFVMAGKLLHPIA